MKWILLYSLTPSNAVTFSAELQSGEKQPFVDQIIDNMGCIISDLEPRQVDTFFEAVGHIIAAQRIESTQIVLIQKYMKLPNTAWDNLIQTASNDLTALEDPETLKLFIRILRTNIKACVSLEYKYSSQLTKIYLDLLNLYQVMCKNISKSLSCTDASVVVKQPLVQHMMIVKKEILNLITAWLKTTSDVEIVLKNFVKPLLEYVLPNYKENVEEAREAEVVSAMGVIVQQFTPGINPHVPLILDSVFESTLSMINKNFTDYPEHRINFYKMLLAIIQKCFDVVIKLSPNQFKLIFDSFIWGIKHTMSDVAETSVEIINSLLKEFSTSPENTAQNFYNLYFISLFEHLFVVVCDTSLTADLSQYANVLSTMFSLVETGTIKCLSGSGECTPRNFLIQHTCNLLKSAFSYLSDSQIKVTVEGFFLLSHNKEAFKKHLHDFMVQIREYTGEDESDLFLEERQAEYLKIKEESKDSASISSSNVNASDNFVNFSKIKLKESGMLDMS